MREKIFRQNTEIEEMAAVAQLDDLQATLVLAYEDGVIDEEELQMLNEFWLEDAPKRNNTINIPHLNYHAFNLDSWSLDKSGNYV